ncbi:transposable element Tcb1 transposase [Trichonephila clavipes]|nr:transposable element Tcb1 transposase [Trichonephila clavipes]
MGAGSLFTIMTASIGVGTPAGAQIINNGPIETCTGHLTAGEAIKCSENRCVGVGTSGSERSHLHEDQDQDFLDRTVIEKTATLKEMHVYSQLLHRQPSRHSLDWSSARGNWTAVEWNQVVFRDESRFNLSSDNNRVRVWRPRGERLNLAFALQRHTTTTAGVMWISARVGVEGNEMTDSHANETRTLEPLTSSTAVFDANAVAKQKLCSNPRKQLSLPEFNYSRENTSAITRQRT